jgi:hypothetical protein
LDAASSILYADTFILPAALSPIADHPGVDASSILAAAFGSTAGYPGVDASFIIAAARCPTADHPGVDASIILAAARCPTADHPGVNASSSSATSYRCAQSSHQDRELQTTSFRAFSTITTFSASRQTDNTNPVVVDAAFLRIRVGSRKSSCSLAVSHVLNAAFAHRISEIQSASQKARKRDGVISA